MRSPYRGTAAQREADMTDDALRQRLGALRELVGLSRTRLAERELAEAGKVLEQAHARGRLPRDFTTVALAGATGSGKSSLFNALAGAKLSETGMRRPTTAAPIACTWEAAGGPEGGADGLLDRLSIPSSARRRLRVPAPPTGMGGAASGAYGTYGTGQDSHGGATGVTGGFANGGDARGGDLRGLVLIDLPDHDSVAEEHREQVDRLLRLVDAVIWVADPEKYADAVLHERYLQPLAGYAEVTFVVLNQVDRLPGEAAATVLDDLRRLLDEDGMALGEHGEPGARVLPASALSGEGVPELREELGTFVAGRRAAALRLTADLDGAVQRLRPVYAEPGPDATVETPAGLTEHARQDFEERLAAAVGSDAAGQSAERAWLRQAEHACGTAWSRIARWHSARRDDDTGRPADTLLGLRAGTALPGAGAGAGVGIGAGTGAGVSAGVGAAEGVTGGIGGGKNAGVERSGKQGERGSAASVSGRGGAGAGSGSGSGSVQPRGSGRAGGAGAVREQAYVARPVVDLAVRELTDQATDGLPEAWADAVREAGRRGAEELPDALDTALREESEADEAVVGPDGTEQGLPRPTWWKVAAVTQIVLLVFQVLGMCWMLGELVGLVGGVGWLPMALVGFGAAGAPVMAWGCRAAARGPARAYGMEKERRLREVAASLGRTRVLEPVAAELLRYREVREQYVIAAGGVDRA
ncbi:GTPase [Streptomyces sp. ODS28]|uniref:GTPase n=1 Tax=Streptomyces sp. ODS28 TaxID=3136688 RepID=UPI0031F03D16